MSGEGAPTGPPVDCHDLRVAVVAARWHETIMDGLLAGARRALVEHQVEAVVALGAVIRGGTPHFDYVCAAATDGLSRVALDTGTAIGFGLLTCDNEEQARLRAGLDDSTEDKGYDATATALATAMTLRRIRRGYEG